MPTLREKYPLDSKKPLKKILVGSYIYLAIAFMIGVFLFFIAKTFGEETKAMIFRPAIYILIALGILILALKYIYELFYLKYYFYDLNRKNIIIKKGVFSRNEITLPLSRLQDVYVDQDILDRLFGLYDVYVSSATFISGNLSHIDGLNKENSEAIKLLILNGISKNE